MIDHPPKPSGTKRNETKQILPSVDVVKAIMMALLVAVALGGVGLVQVLFVEAVTTSYSPRDNHHNYYQGQKKQTASIPTTTKTLGQITAHFGDPISIWNSIDTWHNCHLLDVPDIPTRAFAVVKNDSLNQNNRNSTTTTTIIHMMQGSTSFHLMTGPTLWNVSRECEATRNSTQHPEPSMFAGDEYLDSTFLLDKNGTVVALVHTEYPGNRYDNCNLTTNNTGNYVYPYCWTVSLGLMVSHDFGYTWKHARPPPHHLVATVPYKYNSNQLASGWGDPTNIVFHDNYYYVAMWNRNQVGLQKPGVCMMRTADLMDPSSWRAWNGSHYSVAFTSPYSHDFGVDGWDPADHICTVLSWSENVEISNNHPLDPTQCNPFGLTWYPAREIFVMTWACMGGTGPFYWSYTRDLEDLIHKWSIPQSFYGQKDLPDALQRRVTSMHYPSLLDASAPAVLDDPNYSTIGNYPHLFWVSFGHSPYVDGRSAWATPLRLGEEEIEPTLLS